MRRVRSHPGGPLVVWIFTDKRAFTAYHEQHKSERIAADVASYLARPTGWAFLYEEDGGDRQFEIQKCAGLATYSLLDAFARQRNAGRPGAPLPVFFETGLAQWLGAVSMAKDRTLTFTGVNVPRLQSLKQIKENLSKANRKLFVFPLKDLVQFTGYADAQAFGVQRWGVDPSFVLGLFYIQSWEFLRFLDDAENGKRRAAIGDLLDAWLGRPDVAGAPPLDAVQKALGIASDADWVALQKAFDGYAWGLLRSNLDVTPAPPSLRDWPGYAPPMLEPSR